jgi:hypothetical protein
MPTFYVKYRKNGPVGVFSVIAADVDAAKSMVRKSAAAGEEFDILDANTSGYSIASVTGPTGPA